MTDSERKKTIDSWHLRADAYEELISNYHIFTDMAMGLVKFVEKHQIDQKNNFHIMDLAAGTGLVSKLLINHLHLSPATLYLVEPAAKMCIHAQENIKCSNIYQVMAEDCLSIESLPRNSFDFILCNASMHLMYEKDIYPIISQLLKPKTGYFLYTLWYHSFDETQYYDRVHKIERFIDDTLTFFKYPRYSSTGENKTQTKNPLIRSREELQTIADKNGLKLDSCTIQTHHTPVSFDLDFMLMMPNWLGEHLQHYAWTQTEDVSIMTERVLERIRALTKDKYNDIPVVQVILSKL